MAPEGSRAPLGLCLTVLTALVAVACSDPAPPAADASVDVARDAGPDPCRALADGGCAACTQATSCGWCARDNTCRRGEASVSADGQCTGTDWRWTIGVCVGLRACDDSRSCTECIERRNCGWCASSQRCLSGLQTGPVEGQCPSASWTWETHLCR